MHYIMYLSSYRAHEHSHLFIWGCYCWDLKFAFCSYPMGQTLPRTPPRNVSQCQQGKHLWEASADHRKVDNMGSIVGKERIKGQVMQLEKIPETEAQEEEDAAERHKEEEDVAVE